MHLKFKKPNYNRFVDEKFHVLLQNMKRTSFSAVYYPNSNMNKAYILLKDETFSTYL